MILYKKTSGWNDQYHDYTEISDRCIISRESPNRLERKFNGAIKRVGSNFAILAEDSVRV